jgi:hypothetical protein
VTVGIPLYKKTRKYPISESLTQGKKILPDNNNKVRN